MTRRDYEKKCGQGAMILALMAEQKKDGDRDGDDWHYLFMDFAVNGVKLPQQLESGSHATPRRMLELAAFEAAVVCAFSYWDDPASMYGDKAVTGLDPDRLARIVMLSHEIRGLNREMVLEIGRLLLEVPPDRDEAKGGEPDAPDPVELAVV